MMMVMGGDNVSFSMTLVDRVSEILVKIDKQLKSFSKQMSTSMTGMSSSAKTGTGSFEKGMKDIGDASEAAARRSKTALGSISATMDELSKKQQQVATANVANVKKSVEAQVREYKNLENKYRHLKSVLSSIPSAVSSKSFSMGAAIPAGIQSRFNKMRTAKGIAPGMDIAAAMYGYGGYSGYNAIRGTYMAQSRAILSNNQNQARLRDAAVKGLSQDILKGRAYNAALSDMLEVSKKRKAIRSGLRSLREAGANPFGGAHTQLSQATLYRDTMLAAYGGYSPIISKDITRARGSVMPRKERFNPHKSGFVAGLLGWHDAGATGVPGAKDSLTGRFVGKGVGAYKNPKDMPVFSAGMVAATASYALVRFTQTMLEADKSLQEVFRQAEFGGSNTQRQLYARNAAEIMAKYGTTAQQTNDIATSLLKAGIVDTTASISNQQKFLKASTDSIARNALILQTDPQGLIDVATQTAITFANSYRYKTDANGVTTRTNQRYGLMGAYNEFILGENGQSSALEVLNTVDKLAKGKTDVPKIMSILQKGTTHFANMGMSTQDMVGEAGYLSQFIAQAGIAEKTIRAQSEILNMTDSSLTNKKWADTIGVLRTGKGNEKFSLSMLNQIMKERGGVTATKFFMKVLRNKFGDDIGQAANLLKKLNGEYGARMASLMYGIKFDASGNLARKKVKGKDGKDVWVYDSMTDAGSFPQFMDDVRKTVQSGESKFDAENEFYKSQMSMSTQLTRVGNSLVGVGMTLAAALDPIVAPLLGSAANAVGQLPGILNRHPSMGMAAGTVLYSAFAMFVLKLLQGYLRTGFEWIPGFKNAQQRIQTLKGMKTGLRTMMGLESNNGRELVMSPKALRAENIREGRKQFRTGLAYAGGTLIEGLATPIAGIITPMILDSFQKSKFGGSLYERGYGALSEALPGLVKPLARDKKTGELTTESKDSLGIFGGSVNAIATVAAMALTSMAGSIVTWLGATLASYMTLAGGSLFGGIAAATSAGAATLGVLLPEILIIVGTGAAILGILGLIFGWWKSKEQREADNKKAAYQRLVEQGIAPSLRTIKGVKTLDGKSYNVQVTDTSNLTEEAKTAWLKDHPIKMTPMQRYAYEFEKSRKRTEAYWRDSTISDSSKNETEWTRIKAMPDYIMTPLGMQPNPVKSDAMIVQQSRQVGQWFLSIRQWLEGDPGGPNGMRLKAERELAAKAFERDKAEKLAQANEFANTIKNSHDALLQSNKATEAAIKAVPKELHLTFSGLPDGVFVTSTTPHVNVGVVNAPKKPGYAH